MKGPEQENCWGFRLYRVCPNLRKIECLPITHGSVGWTVLSSVSHSEAQADGGTTFRSCLGDWGRGRDGWDDTCHFCLGLEMSAWNRHLSPPNLKEAGKLAADGTFGERFCLHRSGGLGERALFLSWFPHLYNRDMSGTNLFRVAVGTDCHNNSKTPIPLPGTVKISQGTLRLSLRFSYYGSCLISRL